jgi:hypothetical protein
MLLITDMVTYVRKAAVFGGFLVIPCSGLFAQFTDVTSEILILHYHQDNQVIGGGVAVFDIDNDGLLDIYLTGGEMPDKLLKNMGNWHFENISVGAGIPPGLVTMGVVTGDVNNDGFADIFLATRGGLPCMLLMNNGDGTFSDISASSGIVHNSWSTAAAMADVNGDGLLDIYVSNYVEQYNGVTLNDDGILIGLDITCSPNFLYLNQGNGTFVETAQQYGCADIGCGLAAAFSDASGDGYPELIVVNDFGEYHLPSILLSHPQSDSPFIDDTENNQFSFAISGMGVAIGDPDNDGDLDYYLTNLGANVFALNDGNGNFSDQAFASGIDDPVSNGAPSTGWGTAFFDIDNDGWEDLFVANGYLTTGTMLPNALENMDRMFVNNSDGTFSDRSLEWGINSPDWSRGMAFGDLDNDGDLDMVVTVADNTGMNGQLTRFYRNDVQNSNHWLMVTLEGTQSNRSAFGTIVRAYVSGQMMTRELNGGSSCSSQNMPLVHFGLGASLSVDSVVVRYPSGIIVRRFDVMADQVIHIPEYDLVTSLSPSNPCPLSNSRVHLGEVHFPQCFEAKHKSLSIYDSLGRLWYELHTSDQSIILPNLSSGYYTLSIEQGESTASLKLVVTN